MLLSNGFNVLNRDAGRPLRARYYTNTVGSVWDDESTWTSSGNSLYFSGIIQEIDSERGSDDALLIEAGRLKFGDLKCFINGSIETTSGTKMFTLAVSGNSATEIVYQEISPGAHVGEWAGTNIFKVIYLRELTGGSLY